VYAYKTETFGPQGTLGRVSEREVVLVRDLRAALACLNPELPESAREQAIEKLTRIDFARSLIQHNREFFGFIRGGVPVEWREPGGETKHALARVIDFRNAGNNRFLAVRELKIQFFPLVAGPVTSQKDGKKKSRNGFQPLENHAARCRVYLLPRIIEKLPGPFLKVSKIQKNLFFLDLTIRSTVI